MGDTIIVVRGLNLFNLYLDKKRIIAKRNPWAKNFIRSSNVTPGVHCILDYFLLSRHAQSFVTNIDFVPGQVPVRSSFVLMSF